MLILLSDVDALYTKPPHEPGAERLDFVAYGDELAGLEFGSVGSAGVGTGGAATKVSAARLAADSGTSVLVTNSTMVDKALAGEMIGTWFEARPAMSSTNGTN
ncbi:unannotated protein [freshwater metagenome]|uniref:Unannotated protein n=1 Tax=freshwater metagenome TaxID=449393 RepID=A0A6J6E1W3_9ZZZZ